MRNLSGLTFVLLAACSWGNQSGTPTTDSSGGGGGGGGGGAVCGDGECSPGEINTCPADCGGNVGSGSGSGSGSSTLPSCGNGTCEPNLGEDVNNCPQDCGAGSGSGSDGSGALDCSDPLVIAACGACALQPSSCTTEINATTCAPCFM